MLALEVCKLDSLSIQNTQKLVLQPQGCTCAPALSTLASPETCVKYSAAREACILCGSTLISSCQDGAYKEQWLVHGAG